MWIACMLLIVCSKVISGFHSGYCFINSIRRILCRCWLHQIKGRLLAQVTLVHEFDEASACDHV